jgi:hypothetical protein
MRTTRIPPEEYFGYLLANDRGSLYLVLLVGAIALASIFLLRWFHKPTGAVYWLVASLPAAIGTLWGMHQYDSVLSILAYQGWANPLSPQDALMEGVLTLHAGLLCSALLYLSGLYFHARDFLLPQWHQG